MLIKVKKFLFFGLDIDKSPFFKKAQQLGAIQFVDIGTHGKKEPLHHVQETIRTIKILRGQPPLPPAPLPSDDLSSLVQEILRFQDAIEKSIDEEKKLSKELERLAPLGHFSMEEIADIERRTGYRFQFFSLKKTALPPKEFYQLIYIASDEALDYFLHICKEKKSFERMQELTFDLSFHEITNRLVDLREERHKFEVHLRTFAAYSEALHKALIHEENVLHLKEAQTQVERPLASTFAAMGWIPVNRVADVRKMAEHFHVYMEEILLEKNEVPPTVLKNGKFARMGQDLISIFDTPSATDKDPSMWVLMAFMVFFAFIVGDGGYGAVYLGFCLYLRMKFRDLRGGKKRLLNLATLLCTACMVWGLLTNSFFGMALDIDNPLRRFSLVQWMAEKKTAYFMKNQSGPYSEWVQQAPEVALMKEPSEVIRALAKFDEDGSKEYEVLDLFSSQVLLELALVVGTLHVLLGMLRYAPRNWPLFGWMLFTVGGFLYAPLYLEAPSFVNYVLGMDMKKGAEVGLQLMMVGFPLALVLSFIKNRWLGAFEPMTLIQIFADILSYLRLYALGLAGAIVAGTINELAMDVPVVFGVLLVIIAHPINMALGIMGGVIHGLRLNFLEWYHYSFEGNGKKFAPLELLHLEK